jgi:hypothetical protein
MLRRLKLSSKRNESIKFFVDLQFFVYCYDSSIVIHFCTEVLSVKGTSRKAGVLTT